MSPRFRPLMLVVALAVTKMPTPAAAQPSTATVAGEVVDATGGALPGALVTLRHLGQSTERSTATDLMGRFSFEVPGGEYALLITLDGFAPLAVESMTAGGAGAPRRFVLNLSVIQDVVEVRGTALNVASSIAGKRAADGIVDMVNADEIGRLPDKNIGETLNRIPGVSMLLEKGEGRFIQIRGMSPRLNNVTINGMAMGNTETESGGRLTPLDVVGGELLSGVQVIKTPTPDMDGQGVGGTLNLTTKQPFDFPRALTVMLGTQRGLETIDDIPVADTKESPYTADATVAGKGAGGRLGWLVGSSLSNRRTPLLGIYQDDWRPVALGANSIAYPTNVKNNVTVTARERLNASGSLELRTTPDTHVYLRSFFAHWDELQLRNRFDEGLSDRLTAIASPSTGTIASNRVQVNLRSEPTIKQMLSLTAGGMHRIGGFTADATFQRNHNRVHEPNDQWEFQSGTTTFGPDTFAIQDDGTVLITSAGRDRQDPSLQAFRRVRYFEQLSVEKSTAGALNVRRDLATGGRWPSYLKAGAKFIRTDRTTDAAQSTFNAGTQAWNAAASPVLTAGAFTNPIPLRSMPNLWLNLGRLNDFFASNRHDARYFRFDSAATYLSEYQSDFTLREDVMAGYVMGKIDFGPRGITAGVRVETTDVRTSAFTMVTQSGQRVARPIGGGGSYTNVLPSVVGTFAIGPELVARAAFTTSLGRPEYDAIAPRSQLAIEENPVIGTIGTLSIGNPDLEARRSRNVDGSLEWYFSPGSLASVALFHKRITNEIIPAPTERLGAYTFEGQTFARFDINTTVNAEDAFVRGVEFTLSSRLGWLPAPFDGLGLSTSLTLLDSGVDVQREGETLRLPLLQQADRAASLSVYYQKGRWDLMGTYKYNANFWTDYGTSRALDLDQGSFGRFDCRVLFSLTPDIRVTLSGINLNDEPTSEFQGGNARQNTEYEYTGRTVLLGISARLGR